MLTDKVPRSPETFTLLGSADPLDGARRQLLVGLLLVGLGATVLAYLTQWPQVDPLDRVSLPLLFTALVAALVGVLTGRLKVEAGAQLAYFLLAGYMLVSFNYQLLYISPHTQGLSEATYWFAVVYCTAFMARSGRAAALLAVSAFALSLLSGVADVIYLSLHGQMHTRLYGFLGQFYAAGLASILLLIHISRLREQYGEMRRASRQDSLTGLANRGHGEELLDAACQSGRSLALILFDLDHFKQVNDRHGHAVGDAALRAAAESALGHLPNGGYGVRWGGEEFLLIMPGLTQAQARHVAERIRSHLSTLHRHHELPRLTASFGVVVRRPGEAPSALLRRADAALYRAKEGGRNRVHTETSNVPG